VLRGAPSPFRGRGGFQPSLDGPTRGSTTRAFDHDAGADSSRTKLTQEAMLKPARRHKRRSGALTATRRLDVLAQTICARALARSAYSPTARDRQICMCRGVCCPRSAPRGHAPCRYGSAFWDTRVRRVARRAVVRARGCSCRTRQRLLSLARPTCTSARCDGGSAPRTDPPDAPQRSFVGSRACSRFSFCEADRALRRSTEQGCSSSRRRAAPLPPRRPAR
jgi:hypothetical protein